MRLLHSQIEGLHIPEACVEERDWDARAFLFPEVEEDAVLF
jgi:hypothetical protein